MIHLILVYDTKSGILLYKKSIEPINGEADILTGFFHALDLYLSDFFVDECDEGILLRLKSKIISISPVVKTETNLVIVADKSDTHILEDLKLEINELLHYFRYTFDIYSGNVGYFRVFDEYMTRIIESRTLEVRISQ